MKTAKINSKAAQRTANKLETAPIEEKAAATGGITEVPANAVSAETLCYKDLQARAKTLKVKASGSRLDILGRVLEAENTTNTC